VIRAYDLDLPDRQREALEMVAKALPSLENNE
jgi:hypothetical protein